MRPTPPVKPNLLPHVSAALKLFCILTAILLMLPVQALCRLLGLPLATLLPMYFHRFLVRMIGIKVRRRGDVATREPILFIANHVSYLDIPAFGSLVKTAFIAKAEVARWPLIGTLAKMQNTLFVERRATKVTEQRDALQQRLALGKNLVLFAEGTSSDGLRVLPFKSSLLGIAVQGLADSDFTIQPVSIACTELDGMPMTRLFRPLYAWYGDMTLAGHLWNVLKMGRFTIDILFHPPVLASGFADRKQLAHYCQDVVARGIEQSVAGRIDTKVFPIARRKKRRHAKKTNALTQQDS